MTTQMKRFFALCAVVLGAIALFPNQIVVATDTNAATVTGILNDPNFRSVLQAFHAWGNKHLALEEIDVVIGDAQTAADADPILVNRKPGPSQCHRTVDDQKIQTRVSATV